MKLPATDRATDPLIVTASMVEAACKGYWPDHWPKHFGDTDANSIRGHMRSALIAALSLAGDKP